MLIEQIDFYQNKLFNVETRDHVRNVSEMTVYIAEILGFSDDELYKIREISRFHDIGKIRIPLDVLERNGPLTDEEMKLVRKHPEYGRDILRDFGYSDEELTMVLQHHEKPDGSGYPFGLIGQEISIEAKIIGVVDVMDALLSPRAYKKAWSEEKVKDFFIKNEENFSEIIIKVVLKHFDNLLLLRR